VTDFPTLKRIPLVPAFLLSALLLVSCSSGSSDPTQTPEPTATMAPTLPPDAITVGDLVARVEAAWPQVVSMRTTFRSAELSTAGTPAADSVVTIEEVVMPSDRHVVQEIDGEVTDEQLVVDGRVYMKGTLVPAAIAPQVDANTWVEVDPAAASSDSPAAMQVAYLLSPVVSPFAGVSTETRGMLATPIGDIVVDGRTCQGFTFGDSAGGEEGISYELTLDEQNLPCRLIQTAGGYASVTAYAFNVPDLTLTAPDIGTPVGN
jgi:hypothetical protein